MKKAKLTIILIIIIVLCIAGYFFLIRFSKPQNPAKYPAPPFIKLSPTPTPLSKMPNATPTPVQITQCKRNQLKATINEQAGAGNIYGTLEMTNTGKTTCTVELGNTITETTDAKNVTISYKQSIPTQLFLLAPGAKVYSQVHYPNGPQCQSGISPKAISFVYKSNQTAIMFQSTTPGIKNLTIQACTSLAEKTVVDIWPLSKTPITP
jgi:Domain of unknown function (DUF4232)